MDEPQGQDNACNPDGKGKISLPDHAACGLVFGPVVSLGNLKVLPGCCGVHDHILHPFRQPFRLFAGKRAVRRKVTREGQPVKRGGLK
ncbi:hypothetical protein [Acidocella sp.]|uniref:hypothetical protein n=1 Tax=Acidocella sp. TaxID=50710 RepID=UPI003CFD6746